MGEIDKISVNYTIEYEDSKKIINEMFQLRAMFITIHITATLTVIMSIVLLIMRFLVTEDEIYKNKDYFLIAIMFLIGIGLYFVPYMINRRFKLHFENENNSQLRKFWEISEAYIVIKTDTNKDVYLWRHVSKVNEGNSFFTFKYGKSLLILSKQVLDKTQVIAIRNVVQKKVNQKNVKLKSN